MVFELMRQKVKKVKKVEMLRKRQGLAHARPLAALQRTPVENP